MIDPKTVELELALARQARIAAQLIGGEIEELADHLRQANAARLAPPMLARHLTRHVTRDMPSAQRLALSS